MSTTDTSKPTSSTFTDPYQAAPTDGGATWLGGPDASAAAPMAEAAASAPAAFHDPYQAAPVDAHPAWLGGPQAVTQDVSASGSGLAFDSNTPSTAGGGTARSGPVSGLALSVAQSRG